jgi:hypothetical protein
VDYVRQRLHNVDYYNKYKPTKTKGVIVTRTPTHTSSTSDEPTEIRPAWLPPPYPPPPPPLRKDTMGGKNKRKQNKKTNKHKSRKNKNTRKSRK